MAQIKRIFSGIQPTGIAHLGNYLGAIRKWVKLQDQCESVIYSIVDLHSLTVHQAPLLLRENVRGMAVCLLACGIDPHKTILFQQSQVPQHAELAWLLGCRTPTGWLNRMTQWKAKGATDNRDLIGLGLFAYPVLMAADILLYRATHVPVGDDQLQHLEIARDIAKAFNSSYRASIPMPLPLLSEAHRVMSLRNPLQKMSKSDNQDLSRINLSDSPDEIRKKIRKAVTDGIGRTTYDPVHRPGVSNLLSMYSALTGKSTSEICSAFEGRQTVDLKDELSELLIEELSPVRRSIAELEEDRDYVDRILGNGAEKAGQIARKNIKEMKQLMGLA